MYRINEIFNSLQGEGFHSGRAATFVRFAGCNLRCSFCDTDFREFREMTAQEIVDEIGHFRTSWVVLTGGEPTLQADEPLIEELHAAGFIVAMETNGTHEPPKGIDWLTCSPKQTPVIKACNELKLVFTDAQSVSDYGIEAEHYFLQPCDTGSPERNRHITAACVEYIKQHPRWRLSLQTHKLIGIP